MKIHKGDVIKTNSNILFVALADGELLDDKQWLTVDVVRVTPSVMSPAYCCDAGDYCMIAGAQGKTVIDNVGGEW